MKGLTHTAILLAILAGCWQAHIWYLTNHGPLDTIIETRTIFGNVLFIRRFEHKKGAGKCWSIETGQWECDREEGGDSK